MADICKRAIVEGLVQGVWFRGSAQIQAHKLGIKGWAKNLPDGRVEVMMCGDEAAISQLEVWLHKGPPMAQVTDVEVMEEAWHGVDEFTTM